ncbi:MAG TPA: MFS transporter, partial [Sellimonas intestinalis]|nr:MFS transporter [Sellimonas intestinalis]
ITVFSVKEVNNSSVEGQRKNEVGWVQSVKILLTNRYFILVFIIFLVMYIFTGLIGTAGTYYAKYILGNENMYGLLSIAMMIPMFLSLLFTPALTKKFGMQKTGIGAGMLFIIGSLAGVIGGSSLPILLSGIVIRSFGMGPISAIIVTLSASVSDNIILKKKVNIEGMTFSCSSVGIKIGSGVGTALVGWLLAAVGYNGKDITDGAITMIQISYLFIPVILGILVIVCFLFMNIEEENKRLRSGSR